MKKLLLTLATAAAAICFTACSNDKDDIPTTSVTVTAVNPTLNAVAVKGLTAKLVNRNTGVEYPKTDITASSFALDVPEGYYDITVSGSVTYTIGGVEKEATVKGFAEGVNLVGATSAASVNLFVATVSNDFIIEELYLAGSLKPDGKAYRGDAYFKITNNTDQVLYADGLAIVESEFTTVTMRDYTPNIMSEALTVQAIYAIPGSSATQNYPVQPGKSIIIADQAQDHRAANVNSMDLTGADFEWYDDYTSASISDTDNPSVPNLDKIFCYTATIWIPTQQGNRCFAIARMGTDRDTYLSDYKYTYSYTNALGTTTTKSQYKIPNEWIVDAVNTSVKNEFEWLVTAPSLDMGWTYWQETGSDKGGKGTSNRRKVLATAADGRVIYQDTNNSAEDFEVRATPSLK